jgi:hypothetical protein
LLFLYGAVTETTWRRHVLPEVVSILKMYRAVEPPMNSSTNSVITYFCGAAIQLHAMAVAQARSAIAIVFTFLECQEPIGTSSKKPHICGRRVVTAVGTLGCALPSRFWPKCLASPRYPTVNAREAFGES